MSTEGKYILRNFVQRLQCCLFFSVPLTSSGFTERSTHLGIRSEPMN